MREFNSRLLHNWLSITFFRDYWIWNKYNYICIRMMKIFTYLFAVYILALTTLPCVDKPEELVMQKSEFTKSTTTHHHQSDIDLCSPFCTCNCCASPVIQPDLAISFESFPILLQSIHTEYVSGFISYPSASIWQPPRLG